MEERINPEEYKKTIVFRKDKKGGIQIPVDFGDYQIIQEIGSGGMGVIYKALYKKLDQVRALKVLDPIYSKDEDFVRNFRREAQLAAQLKHPNIMIVHDTGEFSGFHYIAMEFIEGKNLSDIGMVPVPVALGIVTKICDALDHAHNKELIFQGQTQYGIIHRDIKPENIMIENNGEVKLMDFGIARCAQVVDQTSQGTIKGTVPYMSPEQLDGAPDIDNRTDIYSLGVVLYELFSGRRAFAGSQTSIFRQISQHEYEPLDKVDKNIPKEIVDIVEKAMKYKRDERFASTFEMRLEINKYLTAYPSQDLNALIKNFVERREAPTEVMHKRPKKVLKTLLGIAGALVVIFLLYFGVDYLLYSRSKGKAEKALSNLEEKIDITQVTYKPLNLAAAGVLLNEAKDSLDFENYKSVRSLCDSSSDLINTYINYYKDSTQKYLTKVEDRLEKVKNKEIKDEINTQYMKSAKERFTKEDYDSTNALLALADRRIKRSLRQREKTSAVQRASYGTVTITCDMRRCNVLIDGEARETTPNTYELTEGEHRIKLTFMSLQKDTVISIQRGKAIEVHLKLKD